MDATYLNNDIIRDDAAGVIYTPFVKDGRVGYRCERPAVSATESLDSLRSRIPEWKWPDVPADADADALRAILAEIDGAGAQVEYIYFNPTNDSSGAASPDVFVYQGTTGDPSKDAPLHFYNVFGGTDGVPDSRQAPLNP